MTFGIHGIGGGGGHLLGLFGGGVHKAGVAEQQQAGKANFLGSLFGGGGDIFSKLFGGAAQAKQPDPHQQQNPYQPPQGHQQANTYNPHPAAKEQGQAQPQAQQSQQASSKKDVVADVLGGFFNKIVSGLFSKVH